MARLQCPNASEEAVFDEIIALIKAASSIAVCGHIDPDGDAIGSTLAVANMIAHTWPQKSVYPLLANTGASIESFTFLNMCDQMVYAAEFEKSCDLFISVDTPTPERLGDAYEVLKRCTHSVAIDHHITMKPFAEVDLRRATAASAGDIVYDLFEHAGLKAFPAYADCIYTAILTDTGRFQYQNTDTHALETAAALVRAGAMPSKVAAHVYQSASIESLHLRALVLQRLDLDKTGDIATSYVTLDDIERIGADAKDCDSLVDAVRTIGGVKAIAFFRERAAGVIRVNLRAKQDNVNVSQVAEAFGGGGHAAAAGMTYNGTLKDARRDVVSALQKQIARCEQDVQHEETHA